MGNAILLVRMKTLILLIAVFQAMGDANGNPVAQSGLEVALAIKDSTINYCTFTIHFVCGSIKSWIQNEKVTKKNWHKKIPLDDTNKPCQMKTISSKCNTLQHPKEVTCAIVYDPPTPPSGLNYVFEFQTNMEGCILIQH